ncbi:MAG: PTS sugar transporter subunit IIA [Ileibacterium sp.]|nr:PTS sugar transporter subunit IIA [Ileibacterium sp.]
MAFFRKKKVEKNTILDISNIQTGCKAANSDEAIVSVGKMLLDAGLITEGYIEGMLNRDHDITTYIGNDIAIPHGEYEVKDCVKKTGLAVQVYPDGIEWGGGNVRLVIGIAATTDEHVKILQNIAEKLSDMDVVDQVVAADAAYIHQVLTGE